MTKKIHFLLFAVALSTATGNLHAQTLKLATGGTGANKDKIYWFDFTGVNMAAGESTSKTYSINGILVTVIIDNVRFSGETNTTFYPGSSAANAKLQGYVPGTWPGDGLDDLYNIGGTGTSNTLINALSTNWVGGGFSDTAGLTANFRVRAYATLGGQPISLGLVFSSAEDDSGVTSTGNPEYTQGTTNGTEWRLLEGVINTNTTSRQIAYSNSNRTARMRMGGTGAPTPSTANVALLYTSLQNTSSSNPMAVDLQIFGAGRSAEALGLIINQDFGDAPVSYGLASNFFFPVITGGSNNPPASGGMVYLSSGTGGGSPIITAGTLTPPQNPRLGAIGGDNESVASTGSTATGDDLDGTDDEDAFPSGLGAINLGGGSSYSLTIPAFKNTDDATTPVYIMAWIDFNGDGIFSSTEYTTTLFTTNNSTVNVPLIWDLSSTPVSTMIPYARFRISPTDPRALADNPNTFVDERSFVALADGETEDYSYPAALPVTFGTISAVRKGDLLMINWSSLKETNNSYFAIEASNDGTNFTQIGTVHTKADNGNSSVEMDYHFQTTFPATTVFVFIAFGMLLPAIKKRKWTMFCTALVAMILINASCNKNSTIIEREASAKLFIRIAQVDINGNKSYSKIVSVINEAQ
ncbi:CshA/CshB family fibrillar adhesin-related protein [Niabella pedocola]|uniref:CshA/CshB family fibrillar adhesin-related protein n=1 Tax=Niabella pedocola TaxID=1752077 RepID=A0ABS8PLW0_9BACT|nr:CshA/CshB family fibrillar adhesin-related protein [Niabella pedocola]MCD2421729.1 CshA/CshB family fibrillar adhesin-related protein [Niabella pedocola]